AAFKARAVAAPRPDAPPATSAFIPSICIRGTLAQAGGAGLRRGAGEHPVAAELGRKAHAAGGAGLEGEGRLELARARERYALGGDQLGPALGAERDRAGAALGGRHRVRAGELAAEAERVGGLAVAAGPERERHRLGREPADRDRPHRARGLPRAVAG